jgi:antitoxin HicB
MSDPIRYSMYIRWSDESQAFLVMLPEWESRLVYEGPVTQGDTYGEAMKHGLDALDELIASTRAAGEPLPEPLVKADKNVSLVLSPAEALVLFDLLSRWAETDAASVSLEHKAEWRVLWNILASLESALAEPFMPEYQDLLDQARKLVHDEE